jgi:hypothetical protein
MQGKIWLRFAQNVEESSSPHLMNMVQSTPNDVRVVFQPQRMKPTKTSYSSRKSRKSSKEFGDSSKTSNAMNGNSKLKNET